MCFSIYKVTINTMLDIMNMFNQKLKTENNNIFKNNSNDEYDVNSSDLNVKLIEHIELEFFKRRMDDIFNHDM